MLPGRKIDTVVFDIGGVLIDWDPRHLYRRLLPDPADVEEFLGQICTPRWHHSHDLGDDVRESCLRLARRHPGHAELIMAWVERGEEMVAGQFDETVSLLASLKEAGTPCYALSNMEPEAFTLRRARFAFMEWFDGLVISGLEGVAKPDPEIFQILLHRHQLDPAGCVFVDDSPRNLPTARKLGITAVHYRSAPQLRADLQALGLPVGDAAADAGGMRGGRRRPGPNGHHPPDQADPHQA